VRQALHHYMDERIWKRIQLNGMAKDFSWKGPASEYAKLYDAARAARGFAPAAQELGKAAEAAGQQSREAAQGSRSSGQASRDSGPAARNQKRAGTSN
jgi:hypothetical protein